MDKIGEKSEQDNVEKGDDKRDKKVKAGFEEGVDQIDCEKSDTGQKEIIIDEAKIDQEI